MSAPTSADVLARITAVVCHPYANVTERAEAVQAAYELGVAAGRVEGGATMGERLLKTFDEHCRVKA